nr:hypothetical protein [Jannaschia sp. LMIT008]
MPRISAKLHVLIILGILWPAVSQAETCLAPTRPFVPSDPTDARRYAALIRADFETYLSDVQAYFRCLDEERTRAFYEAREVSEEYARFITTVQR